MHGAHLEAFPAEETFPMLVEICRGIRDRVEIGIDAIHTTNKR